MKIRKATPDDLPQLSMLFDQYRQFYRQASDLLAAEKFLQERFKHNESVVLVAQQGDELVGFTQLYPSFSSVSMQRLWVLNDLFVSASARQQGVAQSLMHAVKDFASTTNTKGIVLETDWDNVAAQQLYDKLGYQKQDSTYHYFLRS